MSDLIGPVIVLLPILEFDQGPEFDLKVGGSSVKQSRSSCVTLTSFNHHLCNSHSHFIIENLDTIISMNVSLCENVKPPDNDLMRVYEFFVIY